VSETGVEARAGQGERKNEGCRVRVSEFWRRMDDEFGRARAGVIVDSLHLPGLWTTAAQALDSGVDPRRVWAAICDLHDVPEQRRLGKDVPPKR
jgi:hypothetical protein